MLRCCLCTDDFSTVKEVNEHLTSSEKHQKHVDFANKTLLKPNPWLFFDSMLFAIDAKKDFEVENVLSCGELIDMKLEFIGVAPIFQKLNEDGTMVNKIWSQWIGKESMAGQAVPPNMDDIPLHSYSIVNFKYFSSLGRVITVKDIKKNPEVNRPRECAVCCLQIIPNADVGTLLHNESKKFSCTYDNFGGRFHVFHISCLLDWIMVLEKIAIEGTQVQKMSKIQNYYYCPECVNKDRSADLTLMAPVKVDINLGRDFWINSPEPLDNCSSGFLFEPHHDPPVENIRPSKLVTFYRDLGLPGRNTFDSLADSSFF
ncbi:uncharacterized protein LOC132619468 [Lycium barbarum]|uniref:uncharacterized protein LOC132619468 n=1 Tax=Lycium barbarum TaxID=112863 RepID=UPI00293F6FDF|nr:uncharacterized protein LOC132619468 [Lycium barbarum]